MSKFPENAQFRISEDFRERLKLLMEDNDYPSNKQFAEAVGVSIPVISKAVNFGIVPSLRMLIKIADKLEVSVKFLLGIDDENDYIAAVAPTSFYARFDELIRENNLNYGQLASKMDFPRTYIYEWFKDNTLPSLDYVMEIAEYFHVSPDYLLGRTDYRK